MLDHRAGELITRLRELSSRQTVVLLDYSTDADVTDLSTPLSHATLVAQRVQQLLPSRARARQGALACRFRAGLGIGSAVETIPVAGQRNLAVVLLIIGKIAEALSDMLDCFPEGKAEVFPERLECLDPRALKRRESVRFQRGSLAGISTSQRLLAVGGDQRLAIWGVCKACHTSGAGIG
jgi:hypothetical protein